MVQKEKDLFKILNLNYILTFVNIISFAWLNIASTLILLNEYIFRNSCFIKISF